MQLKKLICTVLSLSLLASAAACGASTGAVTGDTPPAGETAEEAQDTGSAEAEEQPAAAEYVRRHSYADQSCL